MLSDGSGISLQLPYIYCSRCWINCNHLQHHLFQIQHTILATVLSHPSRLIRSVFHDSCNICICGFIGYNCMFGKYHWKFHSTEHVAVAPLITEIWDTNSFIAHLTQCELDAVLSSLHYVTFCHSAFVFVLLYLHWCVSYNNYYTPMPWQQAG